MLYFCGSILGSVEDLCHTDLGSFWPLYQQQFFAHWYFLSYLLLKLSETFSYFCHWHLLSFCSFLIWRKKSNFLICPFTGCMQYLPLQTFSSLIPKKKTHQKCNITALFALLFFALHGLPVTAAFLLVKEKMSRMSTCSAQRHKVTLFCSWLLQFLRDLESIHVLQPKPVISWRHFGPVRKANTNRSLPTRGILQIPESPQQPRARENIKKSC